MQDFISQCMVRFSVCDVTFRSIWSSGKILLCDTERGMLRQAVRYGPKSPVLVAWLRLRLMAAPFRFFIRTSSTTVKHRQEYRAPEILVSKCSTPLRNVCERTGGLSFRQIHEGVRLHWCAPPGWCQGQHMGADPRGQLEGQGMVVVQELVSSW